MGSVGRSQLRKGEGARLRRPRPVLPSYWSAPLSPGATGAPMLGGAGPLTVTGGVTRALSKAT